MKAYADLQKRLTFSYLHVLATLRHQRVAEALRLYSGAAHPPLLRWRGGKLERIESNGLVFGVMPELEYPVCNIPISPGDRFLLYTDGVIEPKNARGDSFGDCKFEEVVRNNQSCPAGELVDQLLATCFNHAAG